MSTARERAAALQGHRAGLISRLLADGIDLVAVVVVYFGLLVAWAVVVFLATNRAFEIPDLSPGAAAGLLFAVQVVYLAVGWSGTNRTVGKLLIGLRVTDSTGSPLTLPRGLARAVVCSVIGQPLLLWAAVSKKNAAVYDLFLHTAVLYEWRPHLTTIAPDAAGRVAVPQLMPPHAQNGAPR